MEDPAGAVSMSARSSEGAPALPWGPTNLISRLRQLPDRLGQAEALDRPASSVAAAVGRVIGPGALKDALSGTAVGHPVHPPLTDLPIGFWTSAWALDLIGGPRSQDAARRLVGLGVLTALPTAVTGASDWSDTVGAGRRVGLVHAAANSAALVCFSASWVRRRQGRHGAGVAWGWAGATAATVGGFLGGHLVNALGVGVDTNAFDEAPSDWTTATSCDDGRGPTQAVQVAGVDVLVVDDGGTLRALADRCSHRGGPLHQGFVSDGCVACPWHASVFRLSDGEVRRGPASRPQPRYDIRRNADTVELRRARS